MVRPAGAHHAVVTRDGSDRGDGVATTPEAHGDAAPSSWIVRFGRLVPTGGAVLDVASGAGRHARWFESRGHRVTAIDRDRDALAGCGATETLCCYLEAGDPATAWPVTGRAFAGVVVTRYLHRPLFASIIASLAPGGVLLYETFAAGNERFGSPRNPAFLLRPGELLDACRGLSVVAYEDGLTDAPRPASIQRICAVRPLVGAADAPLAHPLRHPL